MEEVRPLPTGYYLRNFETVLTEARARYGDLLQANELDRLEAFLALPLAARRLYVRMLTRKGPWFRAEELVYREIGAVRETLGILCEAGFCAADAPLVDLLPLLVREELAACLQRASLPVAKGLRRDALVTRVLSSLEPAALEADLRVRLGPVRPLHLELWSLLCFLFFGNGDQDLSSFVLADLGRIRHESYPLDPTHRLFQTRQEVDFLLSLRVLKEAHALAAAQKDRERLEAITREALAMAPHPGVRQQRRYQRFLNELGRTWERRRERELARACYSRSGLPPARERLVRTLEDRSEACRLAIAMAEAPLDVGEERFVRVFLKRHQRSVPEALGWLQAHPAAERIPEFSLSLPRQSGVEQAVLEYAQALGWSGFFAENHLWNALFGLLFWEELFAPVAGAFQHRFQAAPLDLEHPDFFARRREAFERRLAAMEDRDWLIQQVLTTAEAKWGLANTFLSWRHLERGMLEAAVHRVPPGVLGAVLRTMAQSPRAFASGFPDLFLFQAQGADWALWEVKGPGDSLRPEQERWLGHFLRLGCEVKVARVKWRQKEPGMGRNPAFVNSPSGSS